jgi:hypothetical protein
LLLIALFSLNAAYIGSRLGICWELLGLRHTSFGPDSKEHIRDPYPTIAELAGKTYGDTAAKALRYITTGEILLSQEIH